MKKILLIPAIIGLVAVPSFVVAHRGTDESKPNDVRQESSRQASSVQEKNPSSATSNSADSPGSSDDNSDNSQAAASNPSSSSSINLDQAKAIALGVFPGKTIKEVETEVEHGILVYSVRFTDSSRVDVNSNDGSIVRTEREEDDHIENSENDSHNISSDNDDNNDR